MCESSGPQRQHRCQHKVSPTARWERPCRHSAAHELVLAVFVFGELAKHRLNAGMKGAINVQCRWKEVHMQSDFWSCDDKFMRKSTGTSIMGHKRCDNMFKLINAHNPNIKLKLESGMSCIQVTIMSLSAFSFLIHSTFPLLDTTAQFCSFFYNF